MKHRKPDYYDSFHCLADQCPATCCAGWQIVIDDTSLKNYRNIKGSFGERLKKSIDWKESCFRQVEDRCAFLNPQNLCDLYAQLGEQALCMTCQMYPRHMEEFENVREWSLSLSCPEAARIMLNHKNLPALLEWDTPEEELPGEYEDYDPELYEILCQCRELMFSLIKNDALDMKLRKYLVLKLAWDLQELLDQDELEKADELFCLYEAYGKGKAENLPAAFPENQNYSIAGCTLRNDSGYTVRREEFELLRQLEPLGEDWSLFLDDCYDIVFQKGEDFYQKLCAGFYKEWQQNPGLPDPDLITKQLLHFFLYTYFCGAVYNNEIYSKAALCVFSADWVVEILQYRYVKNQERISLQDIIETSWFYAREVEHSDTNLILIENYFSPPIPEE